MFSKGARRITRRSWLLGALFLLGSFATALPLIQAASSSSESGGGSTVSVWFVDHTQAYRLDSLSGQISASFPLLYEPEALAVNPNDATVWILAGKQLSHFDATTSLVREIDLAVLAPKLGSPKKLTLDPYDGSLWVVAEKVVVHIDAQGALLNQWVSQDAVESLQLGLDSRPWVLTKKELLQLSGDGAVLQRLDVAKLLNNPQLLAFDPVAGLLWFADHDRLFQWNPVASGQLPRLILDADLDAIAVDPISGRLWAIADTTLFGFDRAGNALFSAPLPASLKESEALVFDGTTQNLWIGAKKTVARLSDAGVVLSTFAVANEFEALALAPLHLVPQIELLSPSNGSLTNNATHPIQIKLSALCNGIACDPGTAYYNAFAINATLNGTAIGAQFVKNGNQAVFTPTNRLPEGSNTFSGYATDSFGHNTNTVAANFTVDTIPPTIDVTSPTTTLTRVASQVLAGSISEPGTLTVNGQNTPLDIDRKFSQPITLIEGLNTFQLVAVDQATNSAQRTVTIALDTIAPKFASLSPTDGSTFTNPEVTITGSIDDATATVILDQLSILNGQILSSNPTGFAFKIRLASGVNNLTLRAVDPAGNGAQATLKLSYSSSNIQVTNLVSGQAVTGSSTAVIGTFEGPANTGITVNGVVAEIFGNRFFANGVPLKEGDNVLTVIANTIDGEIARQLLTVSSTGSSSFSVVRISDSISSISTVAGIGSAGFFGDGGLATKARLSYPTGVAVAADGTLYVSDLDNNRIRRITKDGLITTFAGNGQYGFSGDGGPATQARFESPQALAVGADGSVYIADTYNARVRKVGVDGVIQTVAGNGQVGSSGDNGPATQAKLSYLNGVAVATDGSVYIADTDNHRVRKVGTDGVIRTVAGTGTLGFTGDNGSATEARIGRPTAIAVAQDGSVYFSEAYSQTRVRRISPTGIITTVAGTGVSGFSGDNGPATIAKIGPIRGLAVGSDGVLYLADSNFNRIRRVGNDGVISTFVGTGVYGFGGDGGAPTQARLAYPNGVAIDSSGTLYIGDSDNNRVRAAISQSSSLSNIAPVSVAFKVNNVGTTAIARIDVDFNGDNATDVTTSDPAAILRYRYQQSGAYVAKFTVTDTQGQTSVITYPLVFNDVAVQDAMLRGIYNLMIDRLRTGQIDGALKTVTGGMKEKYRSVFMTLQPDLSIIADQLGVIRAGTIGEEMAEYVIVRNQNGTNRAYLIYMLRSEDGVWRIDGM